MTRDQLLTLHDRMTGAARELMARKNQDYAGEQAVEGDALHNFTRVEALGITTAPVGIMTRLTDKVCRLATVVRNERLAVADESLDDTIMDSINYLVILRATLAERKS